MARLLITDVAYGRIKPRLDAVGPLENAVMDPGGTVRMGGREIAANDTAPDCTWLSSDMLFGPKESFLRKALEQAPALKWAQSAGAGVDLPIFGILLKKGV